MKDIKPKEGTGYIALLPYDDKTRKLVKNLRAHMPKDKKLILRGRGWRGGIEKRERLSVPLKNCTHVALYIKKGPSRIKNYPAKDNEKIEVLEVDLTKERKEKKQVLKKNNLLEGQIGKLHDEIWRLKKDLINAQEKLDYLIEIGTKIVEFKVRLFKG